MQPLFCFRRGTLAGHSEITTPSNSTIHRLPKTTANCTRLFSSCPIDIGTILEHHADELPNFIRKEARMGGVTMAATRKAGGWHHKDATTGDLVMCWVFPKGIEVDKEKDGGEPTHHEYVNAK